MDKIMDLWFEKYKVDLPETRIGDWRVEKFVVSEEKARFYNFRLTINRQGGRSIYPGTYTRILRYNTTVMSDTPAEIKDHLEPIHRAKGKVLINGLGLGLVLQGCLNKSEVEHCTVVEISKTVIELVGKHYLQRYGHRLTIINEDAFTYTPPKQARYNIVWHDIWDNICLDNRSQMTALKRKYGRKTDWQGCWGEDVMKTKRNK